jgi:hypothetical protein
MNAVLENEGLSSHCHLAPASSHELRHWGLRNMGKLHARD